MYLHTGDVDNDGNIEFAIGSMGGVVLIWKGTSSRPWRTCSNLGTVNIIHPLLLHKIVPFIHTHACIYTYSFDSTYLRSHALLLAMCTTLEWLVVQDASANKCTHKRTTS